MNNKTDVSLKNFFIFNSAFGAKEGEEAKKVLYYHPITDTTDVQIKNVGLVEGIIQFCENFKPSGDINSVHMEKTRQLYFQAEKDYWLVMTLNLPTVLNTKEGSQTTDYSEEDVQDNVYEAVLKQAYYMYRLFYGTFKSIKDVANLMMTLEIFYKTYLPLDKQTFLKVQCFINLLESTYPIIQHTAYLSGIEPDDMKFVYQYLIGTLLPANMETELQGGSMPRNSASPFTVLRNGRFITGPSNLKLAKTIGKVPKMFLFSGGKQEEYHLVVYRALSASVFNRLNVRLFKELDAFISPKLVTIASDIAEYCSKQVITPSNLPESAPRFIYFNKLNLAYKSTVHLDNKQTGNIACTKESLRLMADIKSTNSTLGSYGETIVKTMNDYWRK
ncbi:hypothetical protein NQ317_004503 [Molorchus minor]|uniref:CCZ1/INTU/HSP4 first Longin domain-containing protein n=1 Tax=Molorchus minor TaxID=1323400 RepID=A0ABQ9J9J9_9CUCU|nr:hypothetical protein NQ317_004503 [Molorchus minor]